jgi:hypothetical protein
VQKLVLSLTAFALIGLTAGFQDPARKKTSLTNDDLSQPPASTSAPAAPRKNSGAENTPASWQQFTSAEGAFSVALPNQPEKKVESAEFPIVGKIDFHMFMAMDSENVFVVGYADLSAAMKDKPQSFLDGFRKGVMEGGRKGMLESVKGRLISEKDLTLDGHPGKEYLIESSIGITTARFFFTGRRFYQALALNVAKNADSPAATAFFSSFNVTEQ